MHNVKRAEYKAKMRDPKVAAGLQHKASQWYKLSAGLLKQAKSEPQAPEARQAILDLTSNLLLVNPDPLYIWNHRRTVLMTTEENKSDESKGTETQATGTDGSEETAEDTAKTEGSDNPKDNDPLREEWSLTQSCLERNPKAYAVWFHRKWCVLESLKRTPSDSDHLLQKELELTKLFLQYDERNFHCWNYRRFLVGCLVDPEAADEELRAGSGGTEETPTNGGLLFGRQVGNRGTVDSDTEGNSGQVSFDKIRSVLQTEMDFTMEKIQENFSNGSAFHYRSKLLPFVLSYARQQDGDDSSVIEAELELVHNAVFTEPDDQTAWWYFAQVLLPHLDTSVLEQEVEMLQDLVEEEDFKTKWGMLGLHQVYDRLGRTEEKRDILDKLVELDPDRKKRYLSMK